MAKTPTKSDKRLTGTWQSDRRKTFQCYKLSKKFPESRHRRLKALFGKLIVRWGRTKYYTELDGYRDSGHYEIVASDDNSVVIRHLDVITGQSELKQIHFEGDYYWFPLGGHLNEWWLSTLYYLSLGPQPLPLSLDINSWNHLHEHQTLVACHRTRYRNLPRCGLG